MVTLDRGDKIAIAIIGFISLGFVVRSIGDPTDAREIRSAVGSVLLFDFVLVWRYARWRLSTRQVGILTWLLGTMTFVILLGLFSPETAFDDGALAVYGVCVLYGVVCLVASCV